MALVPEIAFGAGALALGCGLVWALVRYRMRNKNVDAVTEAATREEYEQEEVRRQQEEQ